ncbi:hypothetical protein PLICRDRAFT_334434 [Plicaturopsis crispa FD-325 SS-3]|uniref:Unplaced genomic scaffold PLICRscaffold_15, whole genome shotgun sequence n=1 Tax=Plicaturopsis crispa FD-325 SS-3 TaxID=944288 RepID=A0A0C9SS07_PLICR|nr:hypothetical protein PLICRDRAFT_334434 [Plicaturopsis crispa FD-325 SS-3]
MFMVALGESRFLNATMVARQQQALYKEHEPIYSVPIVHTGTSSHPSRPSTIFLSKTIGRHDMPSIHSAPASPKRRQLKLGKPASSRCPFPPQPTGIAALPNEILSDIFARLVENRKSPRYMTALIRVTHVCHFWRVIAIENSTLWRRIILIPSTPTALLKMCLERSRDCLLEITLSSGMGLDPHCVGLRVRFAWLAVHVRRWSSLYLSTSPSQARMFLLECRHLCAPNLRSLVIDTDIGLYDPFTLVTPMVPENVIDIFTGGAPLLSSLAFMGQPVPYCTRPPLASVDQLEIWGDSNNYVYHDASGTAQTHISPASLRTLLEPCLELKSLLIETSAVSLDAGKFDAPVSLPSLLALILMFGEGFSDESLLQLCTGLDVPSIRVLNLSSCTDGLAKALAKCFKSSSPSKWFPTLDLLSLSMPGNGDVSFLRSLPMLTCLDLAFSDYSLALEQLSNGNFLEAKDPRERFLLPCLQFMELSDPAPSAQHALCQLITARLEAGIPIRALTFRWFQRCHWVPPSEFVDWLRERVSHVRGV